MNKTITCLAFGICIASGAPVIAQDKNLTFTNPSGWTTTFYGQFNLTYQGVDDSVQSYDNFVDNGNSPSRIGLWIDSPVGDYRFRFNFETALGIKSTSETNQTTDPSWFDWQRTDIRKFEMAFSGKFGTVWAGQGSMATDGVAEYDKSGTSVAGYSSIADTAGAFLFRTGPALSAIKVGDAFKNFDGSRRFRIRYDTPSYSGFKFSAAYGEDILSTGNNDNFYDAAISYALDAGDLVFGAAVGYSWREPPAAATVEQLIGSASVLHKPTGLNFTLAAGQDQNSDASYIYSKLGWTGQPFAIGPTAISIDYYSGSDFVTLGSSSDAWGIQLVQHIESLHLETYLSYRAYSFDETLANYQDVNAVLFGARWKF
jgi:hypothetical protein